MCIRDRIYSYLLHITMEKKLLEQFPRQAVCGLLEGLQPDYKNLYMDNICSVSYTHLDVYKRQGYIPGRFYFR